MIGEWLIDSGDFRVALIMCPHLTFDLSLCSLTTRQIFVELRRLWVFPHCSQMILSSLHPLTSLGSHTASNLTDVKYVQVFKQFQFAFVVMKYTFLFT